uniref:CASP-like protein n=1 Tax=Oryza glumipatula TaxID=40148 RepID=A0A0D9YSF8_9ORYZ
MGTSWLASLWLSSPSVALALVVASAGVGVCAALDGVRHFPYSRHLQYASRCYPWCRFFLQADAFRILVALFLAIPALVARHKSIGSLSKASLLMVGWSTFNDESRGDASLSEIMLTPKSTAQQRTSILCHFRGGNRRGSMRCALQLRPKVAVIAVLRHRGSVSRHGSTAAPCRLAPFSAVWSHLEGFRSSVNPLSSGLSLILTVSILCCVLGFIP